MGAPCTWWPTASTTPGPRSWRLAAAGTTPSPSGGEAQAAARQASERRAAQLIDHRTRLEHQLAAVAVERAARHERVAAMSPAKVVAADRSREAFVAAQAASARWQCTSQAARHAVVERGWGPEIRGPAPGSDGSIKGESSSWRAACHLSSRPVEGDHRHWRLG